MKTSITQILMVCHLLPFANVGQNSEGLTAALLVKTRLDLGLSVGFDLAGGVRRYRHDCRSDAGVDDDSSREEVDPPLINGETVRRTELRPVECDERQDAYTCSGDIIQ